MKDSAPRPDYVSSGAVSVRPEALPRFAAVDTFIFDVDGVIMDVTRSMRTVGCDAVRLYLTQLLSWPDSGEFIRPDDIAAYKLADGFNDDWAIAGVNVLTCLAKAELTGTRDAAALRQAPPTIT